MTKKSSVDTGHPKVKLDKEFQSLLAPLDPEEYAKLEESLTAEGCRDPLIIWKGILLDGHNRYEICTRKNIPFETTEIELGGRDEAKLWIIYNQLGRRNVSAIDRIGLVMQAEPIIARLAKANEQAGGRSAGRGRPQGSPNLANPIDTRTELAKMAGVSHGTLDSGKKIFEAVASGALPANTIQEIREGKESISGVAGQIVRVKNRNKKIEALVANNSPLDGSLGKFNVLYADPPWRYDHPISDSRRVENQYPTMDIEEICALPVQDICADDAILFLWASTPMLKKALRVMEEWGFDYRTSMVWVKQSIGPGQWVRQRHELLLVGVRGNIPTPEGSDRPDSVIESPRQEHSQKPEIVYGIIERMYPTLARIELFRRGGSRPRWTVWGNEA